MQKILSGVMNIGMHVVSFLLDGYCCESAALMQKAHPVGTIVPVGRRSASLPQER